MIVPLLVNTLLLSTVTATGVVTVIVAPVARVASSGWPLLTVEVLTGVVVEPVIEVAAIAGAAAIRSSGPAAAAVNNNLRIKGAPPNPIGQGSV